MYHPIDGPYRIWRNWWYHWMRTSSRWRRIFYCSLHSILFLFLALVSPPSISISFSWSSSLPCPFSCPWLHCFLYHPYFLTFTPPLLPFHFSRPPSPSLGLRCNPLGTECGWQVRVVASSPFQVTTQYHTAQHHTAQHSRSIICAHIHTQPTLCSIILIP